MNCPECGGAMLPGRVKVGKGFHPCHICLECLARSVRIRLSIPGPADIPRAERCALSPEEDEAARRLLGWPQSP